MGALGMNDTGFYIPPEKAARYAKPLPNDPVSGKPQSASPDLTQKLDIECGGGCASTASDYLRFALMLMHGGESGEARILGRKTVEYMLSDQLGAESDQPRRQRRPYTRRFRLRLRPGGQADGGHYADDGIGGLVLLAGASGTDWWADSKEDLAVVYLSATPGRSGGTIARRSTRSSIKPSSIDRYPARALLARAETWLIKPSVSVPKRYRKPYPAPPASGISMVRQEFDYESETST
jgi:CubicO group peptidase (beta-lactamase class C family)